MGNKWNIIRDGKEEEKGKGKGGTEGNKGRRKGREEGGGTGMGREGRGGRRWKRWYTRAQGKGDKVKGEMEGEGRGGEYKTVNGE